MTNKRIYSKEFDSYYNGETGIWLEETCINITCEFCSKRPRVAFVPGPVLKLFQLTVASAERDPKSWETTFLLTELFYMNKVAFDACNEDIAAFVIGG